MNVSSYADRVFCALIKNRRINRSALRALRKANHLLGLAIGWYIAELRDSDDPLQACYSKVEENALHATIYREVADILAERWEKIPERKRPHYTSEQRYRILRIKDLWALSAEETARQFCVSRHTIHRWEKATLDPPEQNTTVKPDPPVRRYADVVRELVQTMAWLGFGGNKLIAQTLTRAGWKISPESVRRFRKEPPPTNTETPVVETPKPRSVKASYPGHVWMADLTNVPGLFGFFHFKIAVILDVFSRMPLSFSVFTKEPTAQQIRFLFLKAMARFGIPRHFISDQGKQFIDSGFKQFLFGLGIRHRFGAIGKTGSIAIIERFWKQLKYTLSLRSFRPLFQEDLERRLESWLFYFTNIRPHQGLSGATPSEVFLRQKPACLAAIHPPRGKPREGPTEIPFEIRFIDPERRLPVLVSKAA